jgi:hypothetical protein
MLHVSQQNSQVQSRAQSFHPSVVKEEIKKEEDDKMD